MTAAIAAAAVTLATAKASIALYPRERRTSLADDSQAEELMDLQFSHTLKRKTAPMEKQTILSGLLASRKIR